MATFNPDNIPFEMEIQNQWVLWKREEVNGRITKVPYQPNGKKADSTKSETWSSFEKVSKVADNFSGIGFVFTEESGIMGVDFDHVIKDGELDPEAQQEILSLNSYAEISPGGDGVHVYVKGIVPGTRNKKANREMYSKLRFFTVTGNQLPGAPNTINEAQDAVNVLYEKWFAEKNKESKQNKRTENKLSDEEVLSLCRNARKSEKFEKLYAGNIEGFSSQSEADLSLCNIFASHTWDEKQIDSLFKESGLYREKWEREDYRTETIRKAIEDTESAFDRKRGRPTKPKVDVPFDVVANRIMTRFHLMTLHDTNELYLYENGFYKTEGAETKINREIREEYTRVYVEEWKKKIENDLPEHLPVPNSGYVNEVMIYIKIYTAKKRDEVDKGQEHLINLKNGIFNTDIWRLEPHDPEKYMIRQIPVTFNPEAKCPQVSKFVSSIVYEDDINVLTEFAGYALIPNTRMQKAVMLYGSGANGKSLFLRFLIAFIGEANTSNESLQRLETDKFAISNLYGKLLNVFSDLSDQAIYHNDTFKGLVGGDRMRGEKKYRDAFTFYNTARLIFSANKLPAVKEDTKAYFRRWILIKFPNVFEGSSDDKNLFNKLTTEEEFSGFLNLALEGLRRVLTSEQFSYSRSIKDVENIYRLNSSPIEAFSDQCLLASLSNTDKTIMWNAFSTWANSNNVKQIPFNKFCEKMKKIGYTDARKWEGNHESRQSFWENVSINWENASIGMGQVNNTQPVPQNDEWEACGTGSQGSNPHCIELKQLTLDLEISVEEGGV